MPWSCKRADQFEPRAVADVCEPRIAVSAEISLVDAAVFRAVENRAPGFELANAIRALLSREARPFASY